MPQRYHDALLFVLLLAVVAGGMILLLRERGDGELEILLPTPAPSLGSVKVYVTGAVAAEGVYSLSGDARWEDAVAAAGGLSTEADRLAINLAAKVRDGEHIHVPRLAEQASAGGSGRSNLVAINTASEELLDTLYGIGEARARNIVASRERDGPFVSTEDLVTRKLIPESVYQAIKDKITLW